MPASCEFRDDVYGRDKALIAILKGDDRKVADVPVEHKEDISHREVLAMPDQPSLFGGRSFFGGGSYYPATRHCGGGGDNFFCRLFGGFGAPPRQRRGRISRSPIRARSPGRATPSSANHPRFR